MSESLTLLALSLLALGLGACGSPQPPPTGSSAVQETVTYKVGC